MRSFVDGLPGLAFIAGALEPELADAIRSRPD
jgi:hypothetical protein